MYAGEVSGFFETHWLSVGADGKVRLALGVRYSRDLSYGSLLYSTHWLKNGAVLGIAGQIACRLKSGNGGWRDLHLGQG